MIFQTNTESRRLIFELFLFTQALPTRPLALKLDASC